MGRVGYAAVIVNAKSYVCAFPERFRHEEEPMLPEVDQLPESFIVGFSHLARPLARPQWMTGDDGHRYLARPLPEPEVGWYSPLEETPELNADLAQVEPTEDSIATFVSDYGWLGVFSSYEREGEALFGENRKIWEFVLSRYRVLWGAVAGKPDLGVLTLREAESFVDSEARAWQTFYWWLHAPDELPTQTDVTEARSEDLARADVHGLPTNSPHEWSGRPTSTSILLPGQRGVVRVPKTDDPKSVAGHARDRAFAQILEPPLKEGVGAALGVRDDGSGVYLRFYPTSVLAAAYMQIARDLEATEHLAYAKCPTCRHMYRPYKKDSDQKGCGRASCRLARYALRRDEAYRLRTEEGLEPAAIAARMAQDTRESVTIKQVNGWIKAAAKRKGKKDGAEGAEHNEGS